MARAATAPELALLRTDGQRTKQFLAVFQPASVYTAALDAVPSSNDGVAVITFTGGAGTLGNVKAGMTLYVGTSAGAFDLGMCRIRKDPIAGTFYIGETSEVEWDTGGTLYLTVVDDYDLWERRMKSVSGVLKADYDIDYSDQHTNFAPVAVMGPDAVIWLDDGAVAVEFAEAANSWVLGSTISGYSFSSDAGAWTNPTTAGAYLTVSSYPSSGHINVWLTVTAANGKTHTAHRYIHVFDADHMPATAFTLKNKPNASYESGGYFFTVEMYDEAALSELRERSLVILFSRDWYGGTEQAFGPVENRENVKFVGRVSGESIQWDADNGLVEFTVYGPHFWLARLAGFGGALTPTVTPAGWGQIASMTIGKALFVLLHWCSTSTSVLDVKLTDDARLAPEIISPASTLWDQLREISARTIFAAPGCDRYGRLFVEIDPQMVPAASRSWPTVMELTEDDWAESIQMRRVTVDETSQINMSSWQIDSSTAALTNYSLSPGHVGRKHGRPEIVDGVLAATQAASNQLAGLLLGLRTKEYEFSIGLAQPNWLIDLWPRQFCSIDVGAADTPRGVAYDGNLVPRSITWGGEDALTPSINFDIETFEQPSVNGDIPLGDGTYVSIPNLPKLPKLPPLPPLDGIIFGEISEEELAIGPKTVLLTSSNFGIMYCTNFNEASPAWKFMNAGLTTTIQANYLARIIRTPSGSLFALTREDPSLRGYDSLWYAPTLGVEWTLLKDLTGLPGSSPRLIGLGFNPNVGEEIALAHGTATEDNTGTFWMGSGAGLTQTAAGIDSQRQYGDISYGMNKWFHTHSERNTFTSAAWSRYSGAGVNEVNTRNWLIGTVNDREYFHKRAGGIIYAWLTSSSPRKITGNDGDTAAAIDPSPQDIDGYPCGLAVDPTGQYLMGGTNLSVIGQRSTDYGATWGNVNAMLGVGYRVWENCASPVAFLAATTQVVKYTGDFGDTWVDKSGNLATLAPLAAVKQLLFISW